MWYMGIHSDMNFQAPLAVLGFLAVIGALLICGIATVILVFLRKIGDENSLRDKKTYLAIPASGAAVSGNATPEFSSSFLHD